MNGPKHYAAAEFHLNAAEEAAADSHAEQYNLARAQVHATLAQAAATIDHAHDTTPHTGSTLNADDWTPVLNADNT